MKVYVITKGCYSDYHICGVVTDQEAAEKLVKLYSDRRDDAEIEVFDTDVPMGYLSGRLPYKVHFESNSMVRVWPAYEDDDFKEGYLEYQRHVYAPGDMWVHVLAKDEAHALKIAADKRAQYLAEMADI